jgi:hypothetical protein
MLKNPAEFFCYRETAGMTAPDALYAVNTPITVPVGASPLSVKLLILIVIWVSDR